MAWETSQTFPFFFLSLALSLSFSRCLRVFRQLYFSWIFRSAHVCSFESDWEVFRPMCCSSSGKPRPRTKRNRKEAVTWPFTSLFEIYFFFAIMCDLIPPTCLRACVPACFCVCTENLPYDQQHLFFPIESLWFFHCFLLQQSDAFDSRHETGKESRTATKVLNHRSVNDFHVKIELLQHWSCKRSTGSRLAEMENVFEWQLGRFAETFFAPSPPVSVWTPSE